MFFNGTELVSLQLEHNTGAVVIQCCDGVLDVDQLSAEALLVHGDLYCGTGGTVLVGPLESNGHPEQESEAENGVEVVLMLPVPVDDCIDVGIGLRVLDKGVGEVSHVGREGLRVLTR